MLVGTAAILTGTDRAKGEQLPDLTGMKSKCIAKRFARHRTPEGVEYVDHGYAIAVQTAGVKFVEIGEDDIVTAEEYDAAFDDDVAMVYWVGYAPKGDLPLADVIDIAHSHGVPVMVDASNSLPRAKTSTSSSTWAPTWSASQAARGSRDRRARASSQGVRT